MQETQYIQTSILCLMNSGNKAMGSCIAPFKLNGFLKYAKISIHMVVMMRNFILCSLSIFHRHERGRKQISYVFESVLAGKMANVLEDNLFVSICTLLQRTCTVEVQIIRTHSFEQTSQTQTSSNAVLSESTLFRFIFFQHSLLL